MWDNGWHNRSGPGWLLMALMMVAFWGGVIWLVATFMRHSSETRDRMASPPEPPRTSPEDILHERLARGEIDAEEYRQRLADLHSNRTR